MFNSRSGCLGAYSCKRRCTGTAGDLGKWTVRKKERKKESRILRPTRHNIGHFGGGKQTVTTSTWRSAAVFHSREAARRHVDDDVGPAGAHSQLWRQRVANRRLAPTHAGLPTHRRSPRPVNIVGHQHCGTTRVASCRPKYDENTTRKTYRSALPTVNHKILQKEGTKNWHRRRKH